MSTAWLSFVEIPAPGQSPRGHPLVGYGTPAHWAGNPLAGFGGGSVQRTTSYTCFWIPLA